MCKTFIGVCANRTTKEFPGTPVGLHTFTAKGLGSIPGWGTKIPQAMKYSQKKKRNGKPIYEIRKANKVLICLFVCFSQLVILSVPPWKFQETKLFSLPEFSQDFGACALLVTAWQCIKMLPPT